jgi:acyl carrier protein
MTDAQVRAAVLRALHRIAPDVDVSRVAPGGNLREEADLDSFDFLNFLIELSESLGVEFPESEYSRLTSIDAIVGYALGH